MGNEALSKMNSKIACWRINRAPKRRRVLLFPCKLKHCYPCQFLSANQLRLQYHIPNSLGAASYLAALHCNFFSIHLSTPLHASRLTFLLCSSIVVACSFSSWPSCNLFAYRSIPTAISKAFLLPVRLLATGNSYRNLYAPGGTQLIQPPSSTPPPPTCSTWPLW